MAQPITPPAPTASGAPALSWLGRALDSDLVASFKRSKLVMVCTLVVLVIIVAGAPAPLITPQNPFDPGQLDLLNSNIPPIWAGEGQAPFMLGTDDQGRDIFSARLYGPRISLWVGVLGTVFSAVLGIALGLLA